MDNASAVSGYLSTGSISGSVLQIINLILGIGIYAPFICLFDRERIKDAERNMDRLVSTLKGK